MACKIERTLRYDLRAPLALEVTVTVDNVRLIKVLYCRTRVIEKYIRFFNSRFYCFLVLNKMYKASTEV